MPPPDHDPDAPPHAHNLLHWLEARLGLRSTPGAGDQAAASDGIAHDPSRLRRQQLISAIGDFLLTHDLEVSGFTLALAHDYLTAADGLLCRMIDARLRTNEPLTLEWLESACREVRGGDESTVLTKLMSRFERNLDEFSRTTGAARSAASDYSSALAAQIGDLDETRQVNLVVAELMGLAHAMLARTRELEKDMNRSDLHTKALRRSLNDARRSAEEDPLTGLPNRRSFEARYTREYAEARAAGEPLCVAFCDIDHFKRINDAHGHEAGDRVLRSVATNLARIADARCHVARHGGEEFVILLRGRTLHEAWEVLEAARAFQAERRLVNRANEMPFGTVTFSGGVANVFAYASPRAALRAADAALYRAKAEGRDRICLAEAGPGAAKALVA